MPQTLTRIAVGLLFLMPSALFGASLAELSQFYGFQLALAIIFLQSLALAFLIKRLRSLRHSSLPDPALQKTKFHLRREIARHEATEELLLETREYLNSIINSLPAIVIGVTEYGDVTHWNIAAENATQLPKEHCLGKKLPSVLAKPKVELSQIQRTIKSGTPFKQEAVALGHGVDTQYCDLTLQPLVSELGAGAVVIIQDVTLRVRVERSMIQNEKMLSLGKMAAGLAHEINNPLAAILSNAQTIERRLTEHLATNLDAAQEAKLDFKALQSYLYARDIPDRLKDLQNGGERAALIVNTMLDFSHAYQAKFESTDMGELIDRSLELAANTIGLKNDKNLRMPFVIRDFSASTPLVSCSQSEIQQVLLNLILNAAQAIHYSDKTIDNPTIIVRLTHNAHSVIIEVQDNGPGMDSNVQKHIFEPFLPLKTWAVALDWGFRYLILS